MRKEPVNYSGIQIDNNVINRFKLIAKSRYDKNIYDEYFGAIRTLNDLCNTHDTTSNEENIILGEDWVVMYAIKDFKIEILEWIALDNDNKFIQTKEMLNVFKNILLLSKGKYISAFMRHDTSYKFYLSFLKKYYFQEYSNSSIIDFCSPYEMTVIIDKLRKKYNTIEEYLNDDFSKKYPEYEKYILHNIDFGITKKFIKKYE